MAYQSNFGETVSGIGNVNVGVPNSARGEGTTTAELVTKVRSLNCAACLTVLIFHTLPRVLNPIRLVMLVGSPIRFLLEISVALMAVFILVVEARIPVFGEKAIVFMRRFGQRGHPIIDLNVASGRVLAFIIMGGLISLANMITLGVFSTSPLSYGEPPSPGELMNTTIAANNTQTDVEMASKNTAGSSALFIIIQCSLFSPIIVMLFLLIAYTLYLMHNFPEFALSMAYESLPQSGANNAGATITPVADSGRPSWVSNILSNVNVRSEGYQSLDV